MSAPVQPSLAYYTSLLTSQYKGGGAPNFQALLALLLQPFLDTAACIDTLNTAFSVSAAVGPQLDVIGALVGVSRTLPYTPVSGQIVAVSINNFGSGYTVGDILTVVQGGASGGTLHYFLVGIGPHVYVVTPGTGYVSAIGLATTGGTGAGLTVNITASSLISQVLSDADYRTLIIAKIAQNMWDGTIDSIYPTWQTLFPGGTIVINDNQDMTATIILTGSFSATTVSMIVNGLIVPRPEGVLYNYVFGTLPLFGFDRNDAYVAGFDLGHWA
jgi:hypothetical protein